MHNIRWSNNIDQCTIDASSLYKLYVFSSAMRIHIVLWLLINCLTILYGEMMQDQDCLQWFYISETVLFQKSRTQQPKWVKSC